MRRTIRFAFVFALGLSLLPVSGWSAFAQDPAPSQAAPGEVKAGDIKRGEHREWCKANPQECKERREQRREWCKKNPEECQKKREAWCQNNPEKCKERREHRREWCEKNPDKCPKPDGDSKGGPVMPDKAPAQ
jgi:SRSO17 transposase